MNELLNRIFGLGTDGQALGFGSRDADLTFAHPLAGWIIALVVGTIVLGAWWSYRAIPGSRTGRTVLGTIRALALVILFVLALGPTIEQTTIHTEQDWVLVLLDRSGSMMTRDVDSLTQDGSPRALQSRDEQLGEMLDQASEQWKKLSEHKQVVWMGFGDRANTISTGTPPTSDQLSPPGGVSTNLGQAISAALNKASARPISGVVIASDGRSFDRLDPELINAIKSAQIPIFAIGLGSEEPIHDVGIVQVQYPDAVFGDDLVPIRVLLSSSSITSDDLTNNRLQLQLIDHATGEVLDSSVIEPTNLGLDPQEDTQWVTLSHTPTSVGNRQYDVVVSSATDSIRWDINQTNNQRTVELRVVDRPMRVLYVDGYPRWEHRYLKNLLLRERSIVSSSMLLASSRRYVQEGDELISALPATLEDWEPFDVIILGDVRPSLFSQQQLDSLLEHITTHGAGVLWIAGPSATPSAWLDSSISPLLPMHSDAGGSQTIIHAWDSPVTMRSTDEADRLGILGLNADRDGWFDRLSDPATGWSKLQWAIELDESSLKPGVSILARAQTAQSGTNTGQGSPIITMMRYGAGRSIFVGTDEIWRWRYGRGEDLPERFWLPLIRTLGRGTIDRRAASARLSISPTDPIPGQPTQITMRLFDQSLIDSMSNEVRVEIRSALETDEPQTVVLRGSGDARVGTWIPDQPGRFEAKPMGLDLELSSLTARARVLDGSDEKRMLDTDHAALAEITAWSGGSMVSAANFDTIPSMLPNRMRSISSAPKRSSLWDRPIVLIILVLLLSSEWIGRRALRLA